MANSIGTIRGYAAVFDSFSQPMGVKGRPWKEIIKPGAFSRTLASNPDVVCRYNHGSPGEVPLGRTTSGTLRLGQDSHGLWYICDLPDTSQARDLMQSIQRRDVSGSSFMFNLSDSNDESWGRGDDGTAVRTVHHCNLIDVAPCENPAYRASDCKVLYATSAATPVGTRSIDSDLAQARKKIAEYDVRELAEARAILARLESRYADAYDLSSARVKLAELADPLRSLSAAKAKLAELDGKRLTDFSTNDAWSIWERLHRSSRN